MSETNLETLRHSCSHVLAQAVKELWPEAKLGIGPAIEDGFYYDFDKPQPFRPEDLVRIEERMQRIIAADEPFIHEEMDKEEALKLFTQRQEDYKVGLIKELPGNTVSLYKTGGVFLDLCKGPHVEKTGQIKAFKLLSIAGAYWRGLETNPMLQRIYGTAFYGQRELQDYLTYLAEAEARDHRRLGRELGYFNIFPEEAGAGLIFYPPKGAMLRWVIEEYERREHVKRGYDMVATPHMMRQELWKTSGHYEYYRDNMYLFAIEGQEYAIKPMNCPGHILLYQASLRSYRELPIRYFELGTVYRFEKAGVLHGLLRVRGFTQDDAHIFCTPGQLKTEIKGVIDFVLAAMEDFGFKELGVEVSTRPDRYIGSEQDWQQATQALEESLKEKGMAYQVNPGEGAFYGPKIDIKLKDALKRQWQCATIQCDFALPERFDLSYVDIDGRPKRPIMLHRVILGSLERFIGALLEHYAGSLPFWLSPVQVLVVPIKEQQAQYARQVVSQLQARGYRVKIDTRQESLDRRIREAELEKIPYIVVVGGREAQSGAVAVRKRKMGDQGQVAFADFLVQLEKEFSPLGRAPSV